ncbi:AMP-binding protein [Streptomyces silvisoli]|uniref:AMP-binding protein n=1 Tax=Streptomyces silvisoli TaxID=3034235 RepID=A0ABT5ZKC8_9ACTN|nr:AMP-binding protein [Streptomyces silvisoli]MDF3290279.1 AMP-binding protein [Streptomyces silvisoli]
MDDLIAPTARLIDGETGQNLSGARLDGEVGRVAAAVKRLPPGLVVIALERNLASVVSYLGIMRARRPVLPLDPARSNEVLIRRYSPAVVIGSVRSHSEETRIDPPDGYAAMELFEGRPAWVRHVENVPLPHPELGVLLSTSGTTGEPRLVRLSRDAVRANGHAIRQSLHMTSECMGITSLPLWYSYGLSVLNSHMLAGAGLVIKDGDIFQKEFWSAVDRHEVTSLAGVPHHFEMLRSIRWSVARHPSLRVLTVSGGRLRSETVRHFHEDAVRHGGRLYVMYGQTEAGPRIAVLDPRDLPACVGSAGHPVPGVQLSILRANGSETVGCGELGEVVCRGPGVMWGYANTAADTARGDDQGGILRTGDLGRLDEDGRLWLNGRSSRLGKVFGVRVNLDAVEHIAAADGLIAAAAPLDDRILIAWEDKDHDGADLEPRIRQSVAMALGVHERGIVFRKIEELPRFSTGKIDYKRILEIVDDRPGFTTRT